MVIAERLAGVSLQINGNLIADYTIRMQIIFVFIKSRRKLLDEFH